MDNPLDTKTLTIEDAGHGGADPGAVGPLFPEKDLTLQISLYRHRRFKELGIPTVLVRNTDETVDPATRARRIRESGEKHCISDHINAGGGTGAEIWVSIRSNKVWANLVAEELRAIGVHVRGVKTRTLPGRPDLDYYFLHREIFNVETLIIEYGFIDSADAAALVRDWQQRAEAVIKGTCRYLGVEYRPPTPRDALADAVETLRAAGIIASPDYWLEVARPGKVANGEYVGLLIQKIATKLKD